MGIAISLGLQIGLLIWCLIGLSAFVWGCWVHKWYADWKDSLHSLDGDEFWSTLLTGLAAAILGILLGPAMIIRVIRYNGDHYAEMGWHE